MGWVMELKGESMIAAPPPKVWAALNDPDVLARCIDGVESLTRIPAEDGADRFEGKMNARVGPVRATFAGGVSLTELDPPHRYVLVGEGKGGVAGFAKGQAEVVLTPEEVDGAPGTRLSYNVSSTVGGKLAQLGARLIEGAARGYAETFFTRFKAEVEGPAAAAPAAAPAPADVALAGDSEAGMGLEAEVLSDAILANPVMPVGEPAASGKGLSPLVWGGLLILAILALLAWQMS